VKRVSIRLPMKVLATVAFLCAPTFSFAASVSPYYSRIHVVTGTIERFDGVESVLILLADGSNLEVKYLVDVQGTRIQRDNTNIIQELLRPGQRATVYFRMIRRGRKVAVTVELTAASIPEATK
jgi:hypothetical protein